ncbi:hypothetical protein PUNSTDRAFT_56512 [Punctularia strigosozonata HHB-11173 SS5]|uniref:uncharacterized protein n=1 Tax=Punctularia strigosozonata (strain HHB-11173) TaxID=741275 RepID=UPI0004417CF5|nr:uncharacterized protein PUNSTDRAFT_56512 [Punctularia strigosozonata HHB-11173 SS5]EIN14370.1 hypothetical protein PUNSTDRAFT_56512 [Punctularia strigosozonata HHB-11173 SS5]
MPRQIAGRVLVLAFIFSLTSASILKYARTSADNIVSIQDEHKYCMIMPRDAHTNIGDSEYPGGEKTFCSDAARTSDKQGRLPDNFWRSVEHKTAHGAGKYTQLTGCIRVESTPQLNADDYGGQYDSSGGPKGQGNPVGSVCSGYNHYVELVEPAANRACIRCCKEADDCPTHMDTDGCTNVIPGNYFDCS